MLQLLFHAFKSTYSNMYVDPHCDLFLLLMNDIVFGDENHIYGLRWASQGTLI